MWESESGEDFEFLRPYLRPTEIVGSIYPCPRRRYGYCPRKIVDYGDGEFAAICRDPHDPCERIALATREALLHELDLGAFLQPILRAASIRQEAVSKRGPVIWGLGLSARRSSMNQPAFLVISHGKDAFEAAVNDLLLDVAGQFLILAPTNQFRTVQVQSRLQARNIGYLCLEDQVGVDDNGSFVSVDPVDSADRILATPVPDRKRLVEEFRAKHRCKVVEIQKAAGVHEADYYKWLNGSIPDHYGR
jgi:hypothetical protein